MKKRWVRRTGQIPGTGEAHIHTTDRPDDGSLVSKAQIAARIGVSNKAVIRPVLERLGIEPVQRSWTTRDTYKNGGFGSRAFDVDWYPADAIDSVRAELEQRATQTGRKSYGEPIFEYAGKSFRWESVIDDDE